MTVEAIIQIAIQYGLPTVLLFEGWRFHRTRQQEWDAERKELQAQILAAERRASEETKRCVEEARSRVEDAKVYGSTLAEMQGRVTEAVGKVSDVAETRDLQRDLIDALGTVRTVAETLQHKSITELVRGPLSGKGRP